MVLLFFGEVQVIFLGCQAFVFLIKKKGGERPRKINKQTALKIHRLYVCEYICQEEANIITGKYVYIYI